MLVNNQPKTFLWKKLLCSYAGLYLYALTHRSAKQQGIHQTASYRKFFINEKQEEKFLHPEASLKLRQKA